MLDVANMSDCLRYIGSGMYGRNKYGLPRRGDTRTHVGGVDDVIHPGDGLWVCSLQHEGYPGARPPPEGTAATIEVKFAADLLPLAASTATIHNALLNATYDGTQVSPYITRFFDD